MIWQPLGTFWWHPLLTEGYSSSTGSWKEQRTFVTFHFLFSTMCLFHKKYGSRLWFNTSAPAKIWALNCFILVMFDVKRMHSLNCIYTAWLGKTIEQWCQPNQYIPSRWIKNPFLWSNTLANTHITILHIKIYFIRNGQERERKEDAQMQYITSDELSLYRVLHISQHSH